MKVWLFPIEPLPERYSEQWLMWWPEKLLDHGVEEVQTVMGDRLAKSIERGEFLDCYDTHYFKATQLARFAKALRAGHVKDEDVVLLLDAWNPAVESIAYMRQVGGHGFKLAGLFHAGTWDPWDMLTQKALGEWASFCEMGWVRALDLVCVATEFHKRLLQQRPAMGSPTSKVVVTGFPLYPDGFIHHAKPWASRDRLVVFPHRIAPEKQPQEWEAIQGAYRDLYGDDGTRWVRSKDVCVSKDDYYRLLGEARVAVSTARQETWGIAMIESAMLGAWPVTPDRLSYPETMRGYGRYETIEDAAHMVRATLEQRDPSGYPLDAWTGAIGNVVQAVRSLR